MIKIIFSYTLFFFTVLTSSAQNSKLLASCCDAKPKEAGRCTGSAYCSACSNCSRCAHCSSGGSCGVCSSSQPVKYTATPKSTKKRIANPSTKSAAVSFISETPAESKAKKESVSKKTVITYNPEDMLAVNVENLKLREGPGNEYEVIENLKKYDLLMVIAIDGEWLQVKVIQSGNFGYVNVQYVYKM